MTAQKQRPIDLAMRYVEANLDTWGLKMADLYEMQLSHQFESKHNQVAHFYFQQYRNGIAVESAITGVHVSPEGRVAFATNRFVADLGSRVSRTEPGIPPEEAIAIAAAHLGLQAEQQLNFLAKEASNTYRFAPGKMAKADILAQLLYWVHPHTDAVQLVWRVRLEEPSRAMKIWDLIVDAVDGVVIQQRDQVYRCGKPLGHQHEDDCKEEETGMSFQPIQQALKEGKDFPPSAGETYHVFPLPLANPLQGARELLVSPADETASPYGWHDVDGQAGADYTITRGNNVHAYQDRDGNNVSDGDEPDGGSALVFDFPLDLSKEPEEYVDAAVTQLFYVTNFVHDFSYAYGFDEAAGNFQENNYGKGGADSDAVRAHAQDYGADPYQEPADPNDDQLNNANFATDPDGNPGRLQLYLFDRQGNDLFTVLEPEPLRGAFETGIATFGPTITSTPIAGVVANAVDNSNSPGQLCGEVANPGGRQRQDRPGGPGRMLFQRKDPECTGGRRHSSDHL